MSELNFNNVDIAIFVVLALSAFAAFFRGFSKELFSILGWVLASLATTRGLVLVQPFFRNMIKTDMIADLVASGSIFIITMILWAILTGMMTKKVRRSSLSGIDKLFGLIFGVIRAGFLITLAYVFMNFLLTKEDMPKMITEAKSFVYIEKMADVLAKFAPEEILSIKDSLDNKESTNPSNEIYEKLIKPSVAVKDKFEGYDDIERESLDDLLKNELPNVEEAH